MAARILHLSDLHIAVERESIEIQEALGIAVRKVLAGQSLDAVCITGDVFDSSDASTDEVIALFFELHAAMLAAHGPVPTIVVPGNHDRRRSGVFGPHDSVLFSELSAACKRRGVAVYVAGCRGPQRAEIVPAGLHGLDAIVATYDSTVLNRGWISAGGDIRQDDLLYLASRVGPGAQPLLLLTHHHLVSTPLTDVGQIDTHGRSGWERFVVGRVIPSLISNMDREEITMTALGAGSALTTLHTFGRRVVVLHGHKHYPTARVLLAPDPSDGDVVLLSAGSAGREQAWTSATVEGTGKLWPSFNLLELADDGALHVRTHAFDPKPRHHTEPDALSPVRALIELHGAGERWTVRPRTPLSAPVVEVLEDRAEYTLVASGDRERWDLHAVRTLRSTSVVTQQERIEAAPRAKVVRILDAGERRTEDVPFTLHVSSQSPAQYHLAGGVCRSVAGAARAYGKGTAFEWVGLVNRKPSQSAVLELRGLPDTTEVFASLTDLSTGQERPLALERDGDGVRARVRDCRARQLLRIYWMLEGGGA